MTLLPEIRSQLLDAAHGEAGQPGRDARSSLSWPRRLSVAGSLVVSLAVAAVLVFGLHGGRSGAGMPAGGGPAGGLTARPPAAWVSAVARATRTTVARDPACGASSQGTSHWHILSSRPPFGISANLPALGRPAPADRRVTVHELRELGAPFAMNDLYLKYAWQGESHQIHFYVIPAGIVGRTAPQPVRCYRENVATFRMETRGYPATERAAALGYARAEFGYQHRSAGVVVLTQSGSGSGGYDLPVQDISSLRNEQGFVGSSGNNHSTETVLLIPSGLTSVTATYPASTYPGVVKKSFSVTEKPFRNLVVFRLVGAWDPPHITATLVHGGKVGCQFRRRRDQRCG